MTTPDDNDFLYSLINTNPNWVWIGFNDIDKENDWVWADGTPVGYNAWEVSGNGEPDGGKSENCAGMNPGQVNWAQWIDTNCDDPEPYFCQRWK